MGGVGRGGGEPLEGAAANPHDGEVEQGLLALRVEVERAGGGPHMRGNVGYLGAPVAQFAETSDGCLGNLFEPLGLRAAFFPAYFGLLHFDSLSNRTWA